MPNVHHLWGSDSRLDEERYRRHCIESADCFVFGTPCRGCCLATAFVTILGFLESERIQSCVAFAGHRDRSILGAKNSCGQPILPELPWSCSASASSRVVPANPMDRMASKTIGTEGLMARAIMTKDRSIISCLISSVAYASSLRFLRRKLEAYATYLSNGPTR